jgi:hypothetical protein
MLYEDELTGWEEHCAHEEGAAYGDPRRCPHHPHIATSSPNGMFDAPCGACEAEMEADSQEQAFDEEVAQGVMPCPYPELPPVLAAPLEDDDIPF